MWTEQARKRQKMMGIFRKLELPEAVKIAVLLPSDPDRMQNYRVSLVRNAGLRAVALKEDAMAALGNIRLLRTYIRYYGPWDPKRDTVAVMLIEALFQLMAGGRSAARATILGLRKELLGLAVHFGYWKLRYRLEDAFFRAEDPEQYAAMSALLRQKIHRQAPLLAEIEAVVDRSLRDAGLAGFSIGSRKKNVYGVYRKIRAKNKRLDQVTDLYGVRIVVASDGDCYRALEVLHSLWPRLPGRLKDYVAEPKPNGYRSIHTTVRCLKDVPVEFQIRSEDMDAFAKYGPAGHWAYKAADLMEEEQRESSAVR